MSAGRANACAKGRLGSLGGRGGHSKEEMFHYRQKVACARHLETGCLEG